VCRYDYSAEDDVGILKEDGGQPMFFGATRQDRASALRTTMVHQNWTAATILHQSSYGPDDGVSCLTLKQRYGCDCTRRTVSSFQTPTGTAGTQAEDRIRFWCINVAHGFSGLDAVFDTLEDKRFYKTEIKSFVNIDTCLNSSSAKSVPNVIVLALRDQTLLRNVLAKGNELGMMTSYTQAEEQAHMLKIDGAQTVAREQEEEKFKQAQEAQAGGGRRRRRTTTTSNGWDPEKHPKNPKVWIVYESELLSTVEDYLQEVGSSGFSGSSASSESSGGGCWILGLGRLSNPVEEAMDDKEKGTEDENGKLEYTSDEQMITAYEASIGFAYGLDGVYNLLLALDPASRRVKLKNSQTVHGSQAENVKIQLSARPLAMDYTGLYHDITFGHPTYGRRCAVFDVIVVNGTNHLHVHGTLVHNCTHPIVKYPSFLYSAVDGDYGDAWSLPQDYFAPGTKVDIMWELVLLLPVLLCLFFTFVGVLVYHWNHNRLKIQKKDAELHRLQDAKSEAWKLKPEHIYMDSSNPKLGEGAFGIVLKAKYGTTPVAVKQFHAGSTVADNEFISEMTALKDLKVSGVVWGCLGCFGCSFEFWVAVLGCSFGLQFWVAVYTDHGFFFGVSSFIVVVVVVALPAAAAALFVPPLAAPQHCTIDRSLQIGKSG
jgi:hypothetical protein